MSKTPKTRWQCPNGCKAMMGPRRPRKNNVCRYCFPCSTKAGILVERFAPALQKDGERNQQKRQTQKAKAAETKTRQEDKHFQFNGIDTRELVAMAHKLPALHSAAKMRWVLKRSAVSKISGRFCFSHWYILLPKDDSANDTRYPHLRAKGYIGKEDIAGIIVHEMAHAAVYMKAMTTGTAMAKAHAKHCAQDKRGRVWDDGNIHFGRLCQRAFKQWNDRYPDCPIDESRWGAYKGRRARELKKMTHPLK